MFRDLIIELLIIWQFRCFVKCLKNFIYPFGWGPDLMEPKLLFPHPHQRGTVFVSIKPWEEKEHSEGRLAWLHCCPDGDVPWGPVHLWTSSPGTGQPLPTGLELGFTINPPQIKVVSFIISLFMKE